MNSGAKDVWYFGGICKREGWFVSRVHAKEDTEIIPEQAESEEFCGQGWGTKAATNIIDIGTEKETQAGPGGTYL